MADARPNVLIITTDQQRKDTMSCYGAGWTHTPNLDALAAAGVLFDRAYCSNPVCSPSRATIFSGKYVSRHGVWNTGINLPEDEVLLSHRLLEAGWRTHYVGKVHLNHWNGTQDESVEARADWERRYPEFCGPYMGFETVEMSLGHVIYSLNGHYGAWVRDQVSPEQFESFHKLTRLGERQFKGNACDWEIPLKFHQSVWAADRAVEFLRTRDASKPFMLAVGFNDPHHPHAVSVEWTDRVDPAAVPMPDYVEGELDNRPEIYRDTREGRVETTRWRGPIPVAGQGSNADYRDLPEKDVRLARSYYYTMVKIIDREVGRILDELRSQDIERDTIVVFTTDHGEMLGDHGLWCKGPFHLDPIVNVPLMVRYPARIPAGRRTDALASLADIVPTVLAAAGQPRGENLDGADLVPLMRGEADSAHDAVFVEHVDDPNLLRPKTVVTRDRKLTYFAGQTFGELYDLVRDPGEHVNLWDDPSRAAEKAELLRCLLDFAEPLDKRLPRPYYV